MYKYNIVLDGNGYPLGRLELQMQRTSLLLKYDTPGPDESISHYASGAFPLTDCTILQLRITLV